MTKGGDSIFTETIATKNNLQLPSYIMAIPFRLASDEVAEKTPDIVELDDNIFLNLVLDEVIQNIKNEHDFIFLNETTLPNANRIITLSYSGREYTVKLYFKKYDEVLYKQKTYLSQNELKTLKNSIGVVTELMFTNNIKSSYLFQLKLVNSLFKDICALVDCSSNSLFSGKWLNNMSSSSVPPSFTYIYNLNIEHDDDGNVWIYSQGLRRCNLYEVELLNLTGETFQYCSLVLPYLILYILENKVQPDKVPIALGDNITLWLEKFDENSFKNSRVFGTRPEDRNNHDEYYMSVYAYINNQVAEVKELLPLLEKPNFLEGLTEIERISIIAKEFFDFFIKVVEKKEAELALNQYIKNLKNPDAQIVEGRIKAIFPIDEDYITLNRKTEILWFKFISTTKSRTIRGELLSEPSYIDELSKGDIVEFAFDIIADWIIYTEIGELTPESLYLLI